MVVLGPRVTWIASRQCQLPPFAPGPINIGTNAFSQLNREKGGKANVRFPVAAPANFAAVRRAAKLAGGYRADSVPGVPGGGADWITQLHRTRAKRAGSGAGVRSVVCDPWLARIRVEGGQIVRQHAEGAFSPGLGPRSNQVAVLRAVGAD